MRCFGRIAPVGAKVSESSVESPVDTARVEARGWDSVVVGESDGPVAGVAAVSAVALPVWAVVSRLDSVLEQPVN